MTSPWYWLGFAVVCLIALYVIPWALSKLDERERAADRRTWREMGGGRW